MTPREHHTAPVQLSKWWTTESCRQAIERAKHARQERIAKVRQQFEAHQEKLKRDVEAWDVK